MLVYSTEPLKEDVEVTGPIRLTRYASSSAPDTDFTAKLVDVTECGFARNLTDGIIRARVRESQLKRLAEIKAKRDPKAVASFVLCHFAAVCGGFQRKGPRGGAA